MSEAGFSTRVVVYVCRNIGDLATVPGVVSYDERGQAWRDGRPYDPVYDEMTAFELDRETFRFEDEDLFRCERCGEPADGELCRDCPDSKGER